jgi:hypothetical protein
MKKVPSRMLEPKLRIKSVAVINVHECYGPNFAKELRASQTDAGSLSLPKAPSKAPI